MDMQAFLEWFVDNGIGRAFGLLNQVSFTAFGVSVTYLNIIGAFIVLSMVVSLFWKGAQG